MKSLPATLSATLLVHVGMLRHTTRMPITPIILRLSSRFPQRFGSVIADVYSSDVESLKQGIIKTSKNNVEVAYTILLVEGTGVGKSSVVGFIGNILRGNDIDHYDFDILDYTNEEGGSGNQSQTNGARHYEFTSKNGIVVRYKVFKTSE